MKKIGILTLQYALNYGGVLQCYALKEVLKRQGYDAVIIDRIPDGFGLWYVIKRALIHPFTQKEFRGIRKVELKPISKPIFSSKGLENILKSYDACIVGSDQVWRKAVFSVNGDYFFQNVNIPNVNKIAYAASMGISEWEYTPDETKKIASALSRFKAISVREEDGVKVLRDNCQVSARWVIDPTMLASSEIYEPLIAKSNKDANGKIVTYILDWTENKIKTINVIKARIGKSCYDINPQIKKRKSIWNRFVHEGVTVYDWVKLLATADFVITDSFHGTVFSIIYNKPFYTIGNPERGMARFTSLLGMFNLKDRLVSSSNLRFINIDYSKVNEILKQKRNEHLMFLNHNIQD